MGCSELELLSSCSEHKLFAEVFVPSWVLGARPSLQRLDHNALDHCTNSAVRFSNIRIICGSAASYISDVLPSYRLREYYVRCIEWYNTASSNLVGQQLEGSKCIWGASNLHTDSNSGKGANME